MLPVREMCVVATAMAVGASLAYIRGVYLEEAEIALQHQRSVAQQIDERAEQAIAEYSRGWMQRLSE